MNFNIPGMGTFVTKMIHLVLADPKMERHFRITDDRHRLSP